MYITNIYTYTHIYIYVYIINMYICMHTYIYIYIYIEREREREREKGRERKNNMANMVLSNRKIKFWIESKLHFYLHSKPVRPFWWTINVNEYNCLHVPWL